MPVTNGKPIIVSLKDTGANYNNIILKFVDTDDIFGSQDNAGYSCGDLLEYMLSNKTDEYNTDKFTREEEAFAKRINSIYEQSKDDVNINVGLFAITKNDDPVSLSLENKITDYITNDNNNILKTKSLDSESSSDPSLEQNYNHLDLVFEDMSCGGYISNINDIVQNYRPLQKTI
jgi:hypothetical protein